MRRLGLATALAGVLLVGCGSGESADSAKSAKSAKSADSADSAKSTESKASPAVTPPEDSERIEAKSTSGKSHSIKRNCGFLKTGKYDFYASQTYAETHKWKNAKCKGHAYVKIKYKDRSGKIRYSSWISDARTAKTTQKDRDWGGKILQSWHKGCADCKEYTLKPNQI